MTLQLLLLLTPHHSGYTFLSTAHKCHCHSSLLTHIITHHSSVIMIVTPNNTRSHSYVLIYIPIHNSRNTLLCLLIHIPIQNSQSTSPFIHTIHNAIDNLRYTLILPAQINIIWSNHFNLCLLYIYIFMCISI